MSRIESAANQQLIGLGTFPANRTHRGRTVGNGGPADASVENRIAGAAAKNASGLGDIQVINDRQNQEAQRLRTEDRRIRNIDEILGRMKHDLVRIVKNYPPYPPGDPERVRFLRSFNGLRQQIEKMTIPPDDAWLGPVPGQAPASDLPDMADDASVLAAADQVDRAIAAAAERRRELAKDAELSVQQGSETKAQELLRRSSGGITVGRWQEQDAEQGSRSAAQALGRPGTGSLAGGQSELLRGAA